MTHAAWRIIPTTAAAAASVKYKIHNTIEAEAEHSPMVYRQDFLAKEKVG